MIKLIKSTFYKEAQSKRALSAMIAKTPILSFNDHCRSFETEFSQWQGRGHSIFVNSGSSANLALIQALLNMGKLQPGDEVGFSALTWSTNVMPLLELGLRPIPVDVELDTLNVSSDTLRTKLEQTPLKALFITHLLGFCDDLEEIVQLCKDRNIILIEDSCESLGSVYNQKKLGNFGLASTFSFYVGHHLSTIEGGMVCTDDEELANMLRVVRAHGWDRNIATIDQKKIRSLHKVNSGFYSRYTFYDLGYNLRPTEIAGFLGTQQLSYADEIVEKRQQNFFTLAEKLYADDRYYPMRFDHLDTISNFAFPLVCKTPEIRSKLVAACKSKVEIRPIVGGNIAQQPFFTKHTELDAELRACPNAELIHDQGLYFANNPELTKAELQQLTTTFSIK